MVLRSVTGSVLCCWCCVVGTGQDSPGAADCRVLVSVKRNTVRYLFFKKLCLYHAVTFLLQPAWNMKPQPANIVWEPQPLSAEASRDPQVIWPTSVWGINHQQTDINTDHSEFRLLISDSSANKYIIYFTFSNEQMCPCQRWRIRST